jgi:antagonist of KipI
MSIKVLKPGLLTTVQDLGRYQYQKVGVVVSGAMDAFSLRTANLLVGNPEQEAALELTMIGPSLFFEYDQLVAITGAEMEASINNHPVKMWRPVFIRAGSTLTFGRAKTGCRTYLTVAGGFKQPNVMGSKSTYLKAGLGGYNGRALKKGDTVACNGMSGNNEILTQQLLNASLGNWFSQTSWFLDPQQHSLHEESVTIRAMKGIEYDLFTDSSHEYIWNDKYMVRPESDRMGYCLIGSPLLAKNPINMLSSAVTFGTMQVPPSGNPIVLMADHQTTGGYPRIIQVISTDLPKLAQLQPGKTVQFKEVSLKEAHELYLQKEKNMEQLKSSLALKLNLT